MPSVRRGGFSSTSRGCRFVCLSFAITILLPLAITPRIAAFTMVSAARRKAPAASAAAAATVYKKSAAPARIVVREAVTSTCAQSSSSSSSSSSSGGGLVEKFGNPERPLRLILVGHNPSAAAWSAGHYYANPSNRMWSLLGGAGIIPADFSALDDGRCPAMCGIGFTDLVRTHTLCHSCL
jgi:TDG/mug DNA glycosylase family protein